MDAEAYSVTESFVAFGRQYKRGETLRRSDIESWSVAPAVEQEKVAALLRSGHIEPAPAPAPPHPASPATVQERAPPASAPVLLENREPSA